MNIYVGNLDYNTEKEHLNQVFSQYGSVISVKMITDRDTGRKKGFAFIEMENSNDGGTAINELNGTTINHREIVVNEARPPKKKNSYNSYRRD